MKMRKTWNREGGKMQNVREKAPKKTEEPLFCLFLCLFVFCFSLFMNPLKVFCLFVCLFICLFGFLFTNMTNNWTFLPGKS